jgi:hypothetical protein
MGGRGCVRLAPALFPILQCRQRDAIDAGKFLLGHPQLSPDGAHIGHFDDMNPDPAGLTFGMFAGLGQGFDQFLAESMNSNRSSSAQSALAWRMNTAVSSTAIGRVRIRRMYAADSAASEIAAQFAVAVALQANFSKSLAPEYLSAMGAGARPPPLAPSHVEWGAVSDEIVFARLSATGKASSIQPLRNPYYWGSRWKCRRLSA